MVGKQKLQKLKIIINVYCYTNLRLSLINKKYFQFWEAEVLSFEK